MAASSSSALTRAASWALVALTGFTALSAVGGAIAMLFTNGLGMPLSLLEGSPFGSFVGPAVILLLVVGGTQSAATLLLLARRRTALVWSAVAAFAVVIWILVETVLIRGFSALQAIYFATGMAQIALVLALLGVVAWFPRWSPLLNQREQ